MYTDQYNFVFAHISHVYYSPSIFVYLWSMLCVNISVGSHFHFATDHR